MSSSSSSILSDSSNNNKKMLPRREIPGSYGVPFIGPILDRFDYFYNQGRDTFFQSRIDTYKSTVFRTNMPPGPFNARDPRVVALLDAVSFPLLFDTTRVEKRNLFTGTYMPSLDFTGGYRVCAYLDPSEQKHEMVKKFFLALLVSKKDDVVPLLRTYLNEVFTKIMDKVQDHGHVGFNSISDSELFNFVFRFYCGTDPLQTNLGSLASKLFELWVYPQVSPIGSLGLSPIFFPINIIEDFLLHTLPFPGWLLKWDHKKLYNAIFSSATEALDLAATFGLTREEACNNLLFVLGFNTYGGVKIIVPTLMKYVGLAGAALHRRIADEVRRVVAEEGGVTVAAIEKMELVKSVVWETMRVEPPVPYQYAKAKEDIVVESHDATFLVRKGEMLFGFQPFATKDERVFNNAKDFVGDRFVGEEGEKLLKYVYWSNGRETENPQPSDKQCPGKNLVELILRVFLVEFFLRFDTFTVKIGKPTLGPTVTITSLKKAQS